MKYSNLFYTKCNDCGKQIILDIPKKYQHLKKYNMFTCNNCVPENSSARNGIEESTFTDISEVIKWLLEKERVLMKIT